MQEDGSSRFFKGWFGRLILPGIVIQSVFIGGGFATGREIVEFGAKYGAFGWLGGAGIFIGFSIMAILTFEFARAFQAFDYRTMLKKLIGKGWILYDIVYLLFAILVISIIASATGEIISQTIGVNYWVGVAGIIFVVGILNFYGEGLIERFKTIGTVALFSAYILFSILVISSTGGNIKEVFATGDTSFIQGDFTIGMVLVSGILYVGANLVVFPSALFTIKRQKSRRDSIIAGIVAGLFVTFPWFLTYFSLMGHYPADSVIGTSVPWLAMLKEHGSLVIILFGFVVGWTLIETATGLIHAFIRRMNAGLSEIGKETLTKRQSGMISILTLVSAVLLAKVGVISLIAKGYTIMAYLMIAIYAVPLLSIGVYKIIKANSKSTAVEIPLQQRMEEKVDVVQH